MSDNIVRNKFNANERNMVNIFGFAFLGLLSIIIIIPFYYLIVSSFKDLGQWAQTDAKTMWLPFPLHPENFEKAITQYKLLNYMGNSLWLGIVQTALQVSMSCVVAYGFARFKFPGRDFIFVILLASMMLPTEVTSIPLYQLYRSIGWTNSFLPLTVPRMLGDAWSIFLIRQMLLGLPKEIDEAAWIDGAGTWRTFRSIIIPQIAPVIVVASLFGFLGSWKDLFGPLLYLQDSNYYTLPLGLLFFESPTEKLYTVQLAAVTLALIPTVLIYLLGNRFFERGINVNDLK